ncbi:hypothetical protein BKH42_03875 [Helicobacter sp. 13S00482-2]|nr:hypothetical protein BKH42_03875 [Helicobacter sp. 13S00482-2]
MTPEEFSKKYQSEYEKGLIYPICPNCRKKLHLYGISSLTQKARFDHLNQSSNCELSDPKKAKDFPSYDFNNDEIIKEYLIQENQRKVYVLCKKLLGNTKFEYCKFYELIEIANKRNIFYYKGLKVWMILYILLTLQDFKNEKKDYMIRFVIKDLLVKTLNGESLKNEIQKIEKHRTGTKTRYIEMTEDFFKSTDDSWIKFILNSERYLRKN